jgi:hypothetical protein
MLATNDAAVDSYETYETGRKTMLSLRKFHHAQVLPSKQRLALRYCCK